MLHIRARRAVLLSGVVEEASVLVADGRIVAAGPSPEVSVPQGAETVEAPGLLVPGFIDLQVNGGAGVDFSDPATRDWGPLTARLLSTGTTAFLPTLVSAPVERMGLSLVRLGNAKIDAPRVLGAHLEGPVLSERYPGGHDPAAVAAGRPEDVVELVGTGPVRMVTLAPERPGGLELTERLAGQDIVVSIGHSDATYDQATQAVRAGARAVTHLFNAQRPLHHREPGVAGAALALEELRCGLILDFQHLHPGLAAAVLRLLGDRAFLVTDSVSAAGLPPGRYRLAGREISTEEGPPRTTEGALAGSTLSMDRAFANTLRLGFSWEEAVRLTSTVAADLLGRSDLGRLAPGALADLVLLSDDGAVEAVWVGGALRHQTSGQG
ncbi:MAG: N-acetylglucosamine-6-phosphate deacetylase [Acidimicrobiia bacterium]